MVGDLKDVFKTSNFGVHANVVKNSMFEILTRILRETMDGDLENAFKII